MLHPDTGNTIFQQALAFVNHTNQHVFLTGKAGTGKTTFLKYVREHCAKKMVVLAPTGVAAINAGGVTLHSFFQLPFGTYLPTAKTVWGGEQHQVYNKNQLLEKLRFQKAKRDLIKELELLIIDEVSMVRADIIDAIDAVLRSVRRKPHLPFGGVQLLLIGDLFQLPPVVKENERELMASFYDSPFFFDALAIKEAEPIYIELRKIYRQKDETFIHILNRIRHNNCQYEDLEHLHLHYKPHFTPYPDEGYITLTTHNYKADAINQQELERLPGRTYKLEAKVNREFPENAFPVDKTLYLKEGAQVMFIKNDKGEKRRYFNGRIATISSITDEKILVRFPDQEEELELELETWRNIRYKFNKEQDEVKEEELGTFQHYPIRLAWAVTIHKSQGLTFDKAIVDAGRAFAPGQVYVALSRLTNLHGLVLLSRIQPESIATDERVIAFAKNEVPEDRLQETLAISQRIYAEQSLLTAFDWTKLLQAMEEHQESGLQRASGDREASFLWIQRTAGQVIQQEATATKFSKVLNDFLQQGAGAYGAMNARMQAACKWFEQSLEEVTDSIRDHIKEVKLQPKSKKYLAELAELVLQFERKKVQIRQAYLITQGLTDSLELEKIMQEVSRMQRPQVHTSLANELPATTARGATKHTSLELFKSGKSIEEIAALRGMVQSTIEGHLAHFLPSGEVKITDLMSEKIHQDILAALKQQSDTSLNALKSALDPQISYAQIRAVLALYAPTTPGAS